MSSTPAAAATISATKVVFDTGAPSGSTFLFNSLLVPITGLVQIDTLLVGVFADFSRDGASLAPFLNATLVEGRVSVGGGTPTVVTQIGGADSFAGAGGTSGSVSILGVEALGDNFPKLFNHPFSVPIVPRNSDTAGQGHLGLAALDAGSDGVGVTGQLTGGRIAGVGLNSPTLAEFGSSTSTAGSALHVNADGSYLAGCTELALCVSAETLLSFQLSGGFDVAAALLRHEVGGSPVLGTVLKPYAAVSGSALFDCGGGAGCTSFEMELSFTGSGGNDAYGFALVQRITSVDSAPVPEPAMLVLLGIGVVTAAMRQRQSGKGDRVATGPRIRG